MFKEFIHEKRMLYLLLLYDKYLYVQLLGQKKIYTKSLISSSH